MTTQPSALAHLSGGDLILPAGSGPISGDDYLPCRPEDVYWGDLPCAADTPVMSVESGATVTIDTLSHEGILADQGRDPLAFFGSHGVDPEMVLDEAVTLCASDRPHRQGVDGPHVVTGPIEIRGAHPGDLLAMTVVETRRRVPYGVVSNRHGRGALPGEYPIGGATYSAFVTVEGDGEDARGVLPLSPSNPEPAARFPLAPFLGIMGVAAPGDVRPNSIQPGPHGGNLDITLLTVGATLYLPVNVEGALAYVGDPHFAQGDGEVALTALEASLRATIRFDVIPASDVAARFGELVAPVAETREFLIPTGLDPDLDVAVQNCVRSAMSLLGVRYGMHPAQALAYLSAATDFNISQVVDLVKGVHARIRKSDFAR
ncbi:acetamidase/formamidase family protein [Gordonia otitidis]|uniref:Amidase n=1 Tax=Gordonia otitidis (strain DSM 44809 / CCUG 52243 / JCM 12355 / NBRC 100426 / IFM 10032) TaxID=1108044 RepID=H5TFZ8_GORO1|nr:acetamidase/formamidase family protein [Gordonia otitidis]GAB32406.1 putative amidase [Gordonia otitidis NBRC 100426]